MMHVMKIFLFFLIGVFSLAAAEGEKQLKTIQADLFLMAELPGNYSYRVLTKGFDSAVKSWCLQLRRVRFGQKSVIMFTRNGGKTFLVEKELTPFQLARITLCFDKGKAVMYYNGEKIGEMDSPPPLDNYHPLKIGAYMTGAFKFPGIVSGVKLLDKVAVPEKIVPQGKCKRLFSYISGNAVKPAPFTVVRGKWKQDKWGYREFSDHPDVDALAVTKQVMPENFVLTSRIATGDLRGDIILEFCRKDDKNGYKLVLQSSDAANSLSLYKKENGLDMLLEKVTSASVKLPVSGHVSYPLTISVGRHKGMIHVWLNAEEILSVFDDTFKTGTIGIGAHERRVVFREVSVTDYSNYKVNSKPKVAARHELALVMPSLRRVFYRDEKIIFTGKVINRSAQGFLPGKIMFSLKGQREEWDPGTVPARKSVSRQFAVDGKKLQEGDCILTFSNGKLKASYKITLLTRPQEQEYCFYNWNNSDLALMKKHLFNGVTFDISAKDDVKYLRPVLAAKSDYAMKHGMKLGIHIPMLSQVPSGGKKMTILRKDGTRSDRLNPWNREAVDFVTGGIAAIAEVLKDYPAVDRILMDSEAENFIELSYDKEDIERAKKELGFDPPMSETADVELDNTRGRRISLPARVRKNTPAVFSEKNRSYRFMHWFWDRGAGDNLLRAKAAAIIKKAMPHVLIHHDPYRDVPLSSRMLNMDSPGTWHYCHPDAGESFMAVEAMLSACRGGGRPEKFVYDPSLWLYSQRIGPARNVWAGVMPSNIYMTALHLGLAAKPEMFSIYSLNHLMSHTKVQFREKHILTQVSRFVRDFVRPLWSATRKLDREQPRTALMLSFGTQVFNRSSWGGFGNAPANTILNLFWKANIPTAIITEENIRKGELARYDRILLYRTSHLPQDVFDKIKTYAEKGGKVMTEPDSPWAKLIPSAVKFAIPTDEITNSTYYHITRRGGFKADIVYAEQQRLAKVLRRFRQPNASFADSNSTELYIRTLQADGCHYVFLMNDRRTFGDYFGKKYKAVFDAGLSLAAEVSLKNAGAVYEFPAGKKLSVKNGKVILNFKPVEGKVLIVYPAPVGSLQLKSKARRAAEEERAFILSVLNGGGKELNGIQPLRLTFTLPGGKKIERFSSARNGILEVTGIPFGGLLKGNWQLEASELASGVKTAVKWKN